MKALLSLLVVVLGLVSFFEYREIKTRDTELTDIKLSIKQNAELNANSSIQVGQLNNRIVEQQKIIKILNDQIVVLKSVPVELKTINPINKPTMASPKPVSKFVEKPEVIKVDNTAKIKPLEKNLDELDKQSLNLFNQINSLKGKINYEQNKLMSSGKRTGWYYVDDKSKYVHDMSEKRDIHRRVQYTSKSKESAKAEAAKPYIDELAVVTGKREAVLKQIKIIESQIDKLKQ